MSESFHTQRHYAKAPIKEAIIDIRISPAVELSAITEIPEIDSYGGRRQVLEGEFTLDPGQLTAAANRRETGFVVFGAEGIHVAHFRINGFTFSRLSPYENWQSLRDEAMKLWRIYRTATFASKVTRVGIRYVNQLDLPSPLRDFRDYVRTYPEISSDVSTSVGGFFLHLIIGQPDGSMLVLNETIVPPSGPNVLSMVLDIDLFHENIEVDDDSALFALMESLRSRKNEVFEGCITNKMRELIS
jgi:uncharacterized protein (TIGR04255 family)